MSMTEKFSLDERFKKADFIRNMRLLDEALRRSGNMVQQQPKKADRKKRKIK